jgi:hypothetical protein
LEKLMKVIALDNTLAGSITMPDRFRKEIVYFMTPTDHPGAPPCGPHEYWIPYDNSVRWLDDGVFTLVSPLDAESQAEIELTEDQERWLEWMVEHKVTHIRLDV